MRWEDERYVRVYTRDTTDWLGFSFEAQALLLMLLRKVDRAGILPLGKHGKRGVAIAVGHPKEWARLEPALEELLADGCVTMSPDGGSVLIPNFMAAQEAKSSDKARQQKARETARDHAAAGIVTPRDAGSPDVTDGHTQSRAVTAPHAGSRAVTPSRAVLSRAQPSRAEEFPASRGAADGDDLPDATDHAEPVETRPALTLTLTPASKPQEKTKRQPRVTGEPTGDPRHAPLVDALVKADAEALGRPYAFRGGRDGKAVSDCLALADQDPATAGGAAPTEVLRRWGIGRRWRGFPACTSLTDLAANWNAYAQPQDSQPGPPRSDSRAPVRAETQPQYDPNKPAVVIERGRNAL